MGEVVMAEDASAEQDTRQDTASGEPIRVLSDIPLSGSSDDALGFMPSAKALAYLIDSKETRTPLIIAISAPWGSGKTSLANLVKNELKALGAWNAHHIVCTFDAWRNDDARHLGAAFAADVAQEANRFRHKRRRLFQPLPSAMLTPEQSWRRRLYVIAFAVAVTALLLIDNTVRQILMAAFEPAKPQGVKASYSTHGVGLTIAVILAAVAFFYPRVFSGTQAVARFVKAPQEEAAHGSMASVRDQLGKLIRQATRGHCRFVIFVDDLERCRPPRAVEVCEVASQLLDHPDVVTVLVADMDTVTMSAALMYRDLEMPSSDQSDDKAQAAAYRHYGRSYLQKIVQMQLDLPTPSNDQLRQMLVAAEKERESAQSKPGFNFPLFITILAALGGAALSLAAITTTLGGANIRGLYAAAIVCDVVAIYFFVRQLTRERRERNRVEDDRKNVDAKIAREATGMTVSEAANKLPLSEPGLVSIENRAFRAVIEPAIGNRTDALVFDFLPKRPRGAKRLLNQVRLMMSIFTAEGTLVLPGKEADVEVEQQNIAADWVGKWLVLHERWPEVAEAAGKVDGLMERLEAASKSENGLKDGLKESGIDAVEDLAVLQELLGRQPRFGTSPLRAGRPPLERPLTKGD
jgi:KAP family P-loop domain